MDERLNTFLTVVRCGSLSQAGRELHLSQPAITLQVQRLEEDYGAVLFSRGVKGVELTPAGRVLFEYARRIQNLYEEAADEIGALTESMRGTLALGATLTIGEYVLPAVLGRFKERYPEVNLLLEVENTRKVVERVASGEFDCGLIEGPFENGLIRAETFAHDELVLVVSPQHPWAQKQAVSLDELLQEGFILREPGSGTRQVFENALQGAGLDMPSSQVLMQVGSTTAIKALVRENLGVTVISHWVVRDELRSGQLIRVKVFGLSLQRDFNFIFQKGSRLSLLTRRFVQLCRLQVGVA